MSSKLHISPLNPNKRCTCFWFCMHLKMQGRDVALVKSFIPRQLERTEYFYTSFGNTEITVFQPRTSSDTINIFYSVLFNPESPFQLFCRAPLESVQEQLPTKLFLDHMMWWLYSIIQNPALKLEFSVGSNDCQITCCILMTFWRLQCVSCRAIWCSVMETQTLPTHAHQPAPFSPTIQTHSHAFTHLLCPPHEELKIDDSTTTKRGWEKRRKGRKKAQGRESKEARSSSKMRGGERGRKEKIKCSKDVTTRRQESEGDGWAWSTVTWLPSWAQLSPESCLACVSLQVVNTWRWHSR